MIDLIFFNLKYLEVLNSHKSRKEKYTPLNNMASVITNFDSYPSNQHENMMLLQGITFLLRQ